MAENLNLQLTVDTSGAATSVGSLKKQLREAQAEVSALADKFGATSKEAINAAKKAAELKDAIGDAKSLTEAFNPDAKFKALTASLSGVAGGFGAIQGAMALFGTESADVQKTLLKLQSAMAISQGLQAVGESVDSFKQLGAVISNSTLLQKANAAATAAAAVVQRVFTGAVAETSVGFKVLRGAIAATGIGLVLVALGAVVAYWDDIKAAIGGVSVEQVKLNVETDKNIAAEKEKMEALELQTNSLRRQGVSEKDILKSKVKQTNESILAAKASITNAEFTAKMQLAAARRNKDILKGILDFINVPIRVVLNAIDSIGKIAGKDFGLASLHESFRNKLVNFAFDPDKTEQEGIENVKKATLYFKQLESQRDGYLNNIEDLDKKNSGKSSKLNEEQQRKETEAQAVLHEAAKKLKTQQQQELQTIEDSYTEKKKKLAEAGIKDNGDLEKTYEAEKKAVNDKYKTQELEREAAFQSELNKIKLDLKLAGIKDEYEKSKLQIEENYKKQYEDIDKNETRDAEEKLALKKALQQKEDAELDALKLVRDSKKAETDIVDLDKEITKAASDLEFQKTLLDQKDILLQESFDKRLISEKTYTDGVEANTNARITIAEKEAQAKSQLLEMISQALAQASDILGKETAAGKTLAVASALINTYQGISKGVALGFPLAIPAVAMASMTGFSAVKNILAVKTPSGGGGGSSSPSMPSVSASAPMMPPMPQAQTTNISQQSINQMGNQAVRAYVIENDVTSNQQRVEAIKQRARFS
jgi:hypothetical protein